MLAGDTKILGIVVFRLMRWLPDDLLSFHRPSRPYVPVRPHHGHVARFMDEDAAFDREELLAALYAGLAHMPLRLIKLEVRLSRAN